MRPPRWMLLARTALGVLALLLGALGAIVGRPDMARTGAVSTGMFWSVYVLAANVLALVVLPWRSVIVAVEVEG